MIKTRKEAHRILENINDLPPSQREESISKIEHYIKENSNFGYEAYQFTSNARIASSYRTLSPNDIEKIKKEIDKVPMTQREQDILKSEEFVESHFHASMQESAKTMTEKLFARRYFGDEPPLMTLINTAKEGDNEKLREVFKKKTSVSKDIRRGPAFDEPPEVSLEGFDLEVLFTSNYADLFLDYAISQIKETYSDRGPVFISKKIKEIHEVYDKVNINKADKIEQSQKRQSQKSSNDLDAILGIEESEKGKSSQKGSQKD